MVKNIERGENGEEEEERAIGRKEEGPRKKK